MLQRKAVSPIISTVLLIMIVIIIASIIILWSRGFIQEVIEKDIAGNTKRANEYCNEVSLRPIVNQDDTFGFENIGNVPVYGFNLKVTKKDSGSSETITASGNEAQINPGYGIILDSSVDSNIKPYSAYEEIKVIPILLGKAEGGTREFPCPEENAIEI